MIADNLLVQCWRENVQGFHATSFSTSHNFPVCTVCTPWMEPRDRSEECACPGHNSTATSTKRGRACLHQRGLCPSSRECLPLPRPARAWPQVQPAERQTAQHRPWTMRSVHRNSALSLVGSAFYPCRPSLPLAQNALASLRPQHRLPWPLPALHGRVCASSALLDSRRLGLSLALRQSPAMWGQV